MGGAQALVIGIGNRLRSDDGAAIQLAEQIAGRRAALQVLLCDQLTPELAEPIHQARAVLFVDAWMAEPPARHPHLAALQANLAALWAAMRSHRPMYWPCALRCMAPTHRPGNC